SSGPRPRCGPGRRPRGPARTARRPRRASPGRQPGPRAGRPPGAPPGRARPAPSARPAAARAPPGARPARSRRPWRPARAAGAPTARPRRARHQARGPRARVAPGAGLEPQGPRRPDGLGHQLEAPPVLPLALADRGGDEDVAAKGETAGEVAHLPGDALDAAHAELE